MHFLLWYCTRRSLIYESVHLKLYLFDGDRVIDGVGAPWVCRSRSSGYTLKSPSQWGWNRSCDSSPSQYLTLVQCSRCETAFVTRAAPDHPQSSKALTWGTAISFQPCNAQEQHWWRWIQCNHGRDDVGNPDCSSPAVLRIQFLAWLRTNQLCSARSKWCRSYQQFCGVDQNLGTIWGPRDMGGWRLGWPWDDPRTSSKIRM